MEMKNIALRDHLNFNVSTLVGVESLSCNLPVSFSQSSDAALSVPQIAFFTLACGTDFLPFPIRHGECSFGSSLHRSSAIVPLSQMCTSSPLGISVCRNALSMLTAAATHPSVASIMCDTISAHGNTVGDEASSLEMSLR